MNEKYKLKKSIISIAILVIITITSGCSSVNLNDITDETTNDTKTSLYDIEYIDEELESQIVEYMTSVIKSGGDILNNIDIIENAIINNYYISAWYDTCYIQVDNPDTGNHYMYRFQMEWTKDTENGTKTMNIVSYIKYELLN